MSKAKPMDGEKRVWGYIHQKYPNGVGYRSGQDLNELLTPRQRRRSLQKRGRKISE